MRLALNCRPGVRTAAGKWLVTACLALLCTPPAAYAQFALGIALGIPAQLAVAEAAPPPRPGCDCAPDYLAWHGDRQIRTGAPGAPIAAVSGAVGLDERETMMQSYGDYNLHVAFAQLDGAYVADVALAIRSADGRLVWHGVSEGPLFFARLPRGEYLVTAEYDRRAATRRIEVGSAPGPLHHIHWKVESH